MFAQSSLCHNIMQVQVKVPYYIATDCLCVHIKQYLDIVFGNDEQYSKGLLKKYLHLQTQRKL